MVSLADNLWFARNQRHYREKSRSMVAEADQVEGLVAALSMQPRQKQPSKKLAGTKKSCKPGRQGGLPRLCFMHSKFGEDAWSALTQQTARGWKRVGPGAVSSSRL